MSTVRIQSYKHTCERCHADWVSQLEHPKHCPRCKSPYWTNAIAAQKYLEVYTLEPGQRTLVPWPEGFISGSGIHPVMRVLRRLNGQGKKFAATFTSEGAMVTRLSNIERAPAPFVPGVSQ